MFAKISTAGLFGVQGFPVEVEADVATGIPQFNLTGALSTRTKEAQYRVWTGLRNSGVKLQAQKITVNLSPASRRKDGTGYDLAIAIALLCAAAGLSAARFQGFAFLGELGLDGGVKPVRGVLPMALALRDAGLQFLLTAPENVEEARLVCQLRVLGCASVGALCRSLQAVPGSLSGASLFQAMEALMQEDRHGRGMVPAAGSTSVGTSAPALAPDFSEVAGQQYLRRAAEIAVAGRHNLLLCGPAGTGKTMIAERIPGLLPPLGREEDLRISSIYSICGLLRPEQPLLSARPFRAPHHSITQAAFAGGGARLLPGELSLASGGVLFLDELPLFQRSVIELLREPLESQQITVSRASGSVIYPADFQLIAAQNNCPCGHFPDRGRCRCTPPQIRAYLARLSKPILERFDLCAQAMPLRFSDLTAKRQPAGESTAVMRSRIAAARERQERRFLGMPDISSNSRIPVRLLSKFCTLGREEQRLTQQLFQTKQLSGRTYHKLLRVARSIADLEGSDCIRGEHLIEAASYRGIEEELYQLEALSC